MVALSRWTFVLHSLIVGLVIGGTAAKAQEKTPGRTRLEPADLLQIEGATSPALSPDGTQSAVVKRWIEADTLSERLALWLVSDEGKNARPLETGEPDARLPVFSPDGKWIAIRSTRPRPEGWKQTPPVPLESEPATDIWLVSADGQRSIPLAGPDKPYGRVFQDSFYGRLAFSPDGERLVFVADDGREARSAKEIAANVSLVRPDQGEGYTGYGTAQIWVAELLDEPKEYAAKKIHRLTDDRVWYGDPQWTPDGRWLIAHANKTSDVESVRYSINKNYDLYAIDAATGEQRQLTFGIGPEFYPRISPSGKRLICLSSPRKGPHVDILNFVLLELPENLAKERPQTRVLFDHHAPSGDTPHPIAAYPLPDECWDDDEHLIYTHAAGLGTEQVHLNVTTAVGKVIDESNKDALVEKSRFLQRQQAQRKLPLKVKSVLGERLRGEDRVVTWTNEGFELDGSLTLPPEEIAKAPYPVIVFPHGGPHSRASKGFSLTAQVFAARGYAVFQPNFRGSAGYGKKFLEADRNDLGGGDMRDILTGIDALVDQGLVDRQRQFVYGVSYGGFMTTWLVGHTTQFRAAVAQNAVTEMNVMWGLSDIQSWTEWELRGKPWEVADAMHLRSPFHYAEKVRTPTLILHSRDDRRCPVAMGRMFHQALVSRGVPTQMVVYPDEGHGIRQPKHQVDVLERTLAWFAAHDVGAEAELVMLGDSITKGVRGGVTPEQTFTSLVEKNLRDLGWQVRAANVGIGGERTDQALKRLERDVLARKPRVVTIMYGTNDSYVDPGRDGSRISVEAYRENLKQLVERIRAAGAVPVLMTEPRWGAKGKPNGLGEHPNDRLEQFMHACRDVARETKTPLVDNYAHWLASEQAGQDLGAWTTDQCHPNPAGHVQIAELMGPVLRGVLLPDPALAPRD